MDVTLGLNVAENLLNKGLICRDDVTAIETAIGRNIITDSIPIHRFSITPTTVYYQDVVNAVDNYKKELELKNTEDMTLDYGTYIERLTDASGVFYNVSELMLAIRDYREELSNYVFVWYSEPDGKFYEYKITTMDLENPLITFTVDALFKSFIDKHRGKIIEDYEECYEAHGGTTDGMILLSNLANKYRELVDTTEGNNLAELSRIKTGFLNILTLIHLLYTGSSEGNKFDIYNILDGFFQIQAAGYTEHSKLEALKFMCTTSDEEFIKFYKFAKGFVNEIKKYKSVTGYLKIYSPTYYKHIKNMNIDNLGYSAVY